MTDSFRTRTERALLLALSALLAACAAPVAPRAESARLGQPVENHEQLNVFPDGRGLPPGHGNVAGGGELFARHCAACHGDAGQGGTAEELAGAKRPLNTPSPDKTIGSYWPYATTLFDFIRRAKPMNAPGTLSADEVYALCAWLLHVNGVIDGDAVLDAQSLPAIRMPNRNGFLPIEAP
jgi:S-disulfanyl-L-cysteine oxidoreductase SoxD